MISLREHNFHGAKGAVPEAIASDVRKAVLAMKSSSGATSTRKAILDTLQNQSGWSNKLSLGHDTRISITACKDNVGLCLQTGNMSRFYADLIKIHHAFNEDIITAAIYLLPCKDLAKKWGNNIAHFERLTKELDIYKKIIPVPILVLGLKDE